MDPLHLKRFLRFTPVGGAPNAFVMSLSEEDVSSQAVLTAAIGRIARLWSCGMIDRQWRLDGDRGAIDSARMLLRAFFAVVRLGWSILKHRLPTEVEQERMLESVRQLRGNGGDPDRARLLVRIICAAVSFPPTIVASRLRFEQQQRRRPQGARRRVVPEPPADTDSDPPDDTGAAAPLIVVIRPSLDSSQH